MGSLEHREILDIARAATTAGLDAQRAALFVGIDPRIPASIATGPTAAAQTLLDLEELHRLDAEPGVPPPMARWLANARHLSNNTAASRRLFDEVLQRTYPEHYALAPATPVKRPSWQWAALVGGVIGIGILVVIGTRWNDLVGGPAESGGSPPSSANAADPGSASTTTTPPASTTISITTTTAASATTSLPNVPGMGSEEPSSSKSSGAAPPAVALSAPPSSSSTQAVPSSTQAVSGSAASAGPTAPCGVSASSDGDFWSLRCACEGKETKPPALSLTLPAGTKEADRLGTLLTKARKRGWTCP